MLLSFFTRTGHPKYYVQFSDPITGKRRCLVTSVRRKDADRKLRLAKIQNALEKKILEGASAHASDSGHEWSWVSGWIEERFRNKDASLLKHRNQWNFLSAYFSKEGVTAPAALTRDHASIYIRWRCSKLKEKSKRCVGRNTALADLRFGGMILREAIERGAIARNPWEKLGFEKDEVQEKGELLDEHIALIRTKLVDRPEWMRRSFEIALNTGLRFSETRIALSNVDLTAKTACIVKPKGGRKKAYSIPLPSALLPMFEELKRTKVTHTWDIPAEERELTGLAWSKFFDELNLGIGYCFHSTRVTFISRGARAGIPEHVMMKLVNHASAEIHRIYRRVTVHDVAQYVDQVRIPPASG